MNTKHHCDTIYEFFWHVAAASCKSADPILHREPPLLKHRCDAMGEFKNQRRVGVPLFGPYL
jgi:hypothetical protein